MKYHVINVKKLHRGDRKDTFQENKRTQICSLFHEHEQCHSWSTGHRENWDQQLLAWKNTL